MEGIEYFLAIQNSFFFIISHFPSLFFGLKFNYLLANSEFLTRLYNEKIKIADSSVFGVLVQFLKKSAIFVNIVLHFQGILLCF